MAKNDWDVDAASATYNVDGWGSGYFSVNSAGNVVAKPLKDAGGSIDLLEVVNEARRRTLIRCSYPAGFAAHSGYVGSLRSDSRGGGYR